MFTEEDTLYIDNILLSLPTLGWKDPDPSWRLEAACRDHPDETDDFFNGKRAEKKRQQYCSVCPVTEQCWTYAVNNGEVNGVWGGRTQHELVREVRLRAQG